MLPLTVAVVIDDDDVKVKVRVGWKTSVDEVKNQDLDRISRKRNLRFQILCRIGQTGKEDEIVDVLWTSYGMRLADMPFLLMIDLNQ